MVLIHRARFNWCNFWNGLVGMLFDIMPPKIVFPNVTIVTQFTSEFIFDGAGACDLVSTSIVW